MLQSSALKETELQSSAFLRTDIGLQSWTWFRSSPMTSSLTCLLWRCFASNLSFPSLFFSPQLCRQSDNPEHSIKGPLIDTRSVQETQHAYKSILLFSHWRAGPVLPGIHYLTYQLHHFNKGHFSLPSPCPLDLRSKSKFFSSFNPRKGYYHKNRYR